MSTRTSRARGVVIVACVVCASSFGVGAARLDLAIGLGGAFVPETFTTVRARIADVPFPFVGAVTLTQHLGNPWQGQATVLLRIPVSVARAGEVEWSVPIYDGTHSLDATLLDAAGGVLTSSSVDLASSRQNEALVVQVGEFAFPPSDSPVVLDPDDLPTSWQSYEGVRCVWLGRLMATLSRERWEALGRWILAGGTLVVCAGQDLYAVQSPILLDLLPVTDPVVDEHGAATRLRGDLRPGARSLLTEEGEPVFVGGPYGAGRVLLLTESALDVDRPSWEAVRRLVPDARLVSLSGIGPALLESMPFRRPSYLAAILLVAGTVSAVYAVVLGCSRPRTRLVFLIATMTVLAVGSGLYTSLTNRVEQQYVCSTTMRIQASLGITLFRTDVAAIQGGPARAEVRGSAPWMEETPAILRDADFDAAIDLGAGWVSLSLGSGERRAIRSAGTADLLVLLERSGEDEVLVANGLAPLEGAILFADGRSYPVGRLPLGETRVRLGEGGSVEEASTATGDLAGLLHSVTEPFPLEHGLWLVAFRDVSSEVDYTGLRQEVRDVQTYVIEGRDRA